MEHGIRKSKGSVKIQKSIELRNPLTFLEISYWRSMWGARASRRKKRLLLDWVCQVKCVNFFKIIYGFIKTDNQQQLSVF